MKNINYEELVNMKPAAQEETLRGLTLDELQKIPKETWRLIDAKVRLDLMPVEGANFHLSTHRALETIFDIAGSSEHAYALIGYASRLLHETLLVSPQDVPTVEEIMTTVSATELEAKILHATLITAIPECTATRSSVLTGSLRRDAKKAPKTPTVAEIKARRAGT